MKNRFLFIALAALLMMTMSSCVFSATEHEHQFGDEWTSDETSHWHVCAGEECTEIADKADHTGGTATETEKAKCEICGAEYGELLAHTHAYGEWQTKTPATCTTAGVEIRTCACGEEEVRDTAKLDHSFTEEVADEKYLATANCEEQATYFKSCACGEKGTEIFAYGEVIAHSFGEWQTKDEATCLDAEVEYRACACGKEETQTGDAALGHNMVAMSDDTNHWTECDRKDCDEATEKVAHNATSISAVCNKTDAMQYDVLTAADFTVSATCECGKTYTVTNGITIENGTLALGANTVTIKVGEASVDVNVEAVKFNKVVDGTIVDDTYVSSGSNKDKTYSEKTELPIYNTETYRTLFRFNFSDVLASEYYADFKDEAIVKFIFTVSNGVDMTGLPITFKSFPASEIRSSADFSTLCWSNYSNTYTLGWGEANNPVDLLASETIGNRAIYADGKLIITVTLREIESCIDEEGNAIFIMLTNQKAVTPKLASMENEDYDAPAVKVIFSEDHAHAYIEKVATEDYLVSAKCEEKATYYYSCSCGEAGTATFEYGDVIAHSFGEWNTKSEANCLDAEVEYRVCFCGAEETQDGDAALGHNMETKFDETNHWTDCSRCDEVTAPVAHFGGEATETEQATCEGCGQKYGGLASHVHAYGEWQTRSAANCLDAEIEFRKCSCGAEETQTGDAALGHDMKTKYDADNHWTECSRCDEATSAVAHSGGTATETEKAVCEGCGQSYGELKEPEKQEYTINGAVVYDTDINSSTKNKDRTANEQIYLYSSATRGFIALDLKDILDSADFEAVKADGKFQLTFTIAGNESDINNTKFLLQVANPTYTDVNGDTQYTAAIPAASITWNSAHVAEGAYYNALYLGNMKYIVGNSDSGKLLTQTDKVVYTADVNGGAGTVTYEITYDDIKDYICMDKDSEYYGQVVFKLRANGTEKAASKVLYYASSETAVPPTIKFVYEK